MMAEERKEYLSVEELTSLTGISTSTWNKRRLTGDGPPFLKVGRTVRYRRLEVEKWLNDRAVSSTSALSAVR